MAFKIDQALFHLAEECTFKYALNPVIYAGQTSKRVLVITASLVTDLMFVNLALKVSKYSLEVLHEAGIDSPVVTLLVETPTVLNDLFKSGRSLKYINEIIDNRYHSVVIIIGNISGLILSGIHAAKFLDAICLIDLALISDSFGLIAGFTPLVTITGSLQIIRSCTRIYCCVLNIIQIKENKVKIESKIIFWTHITPEKIEERKQNYDNRVKRKQDKIESLQKEIQKSYFIYRKQQKIERLQNKIHHIRDKKAEIEVMSDERYRRTSLLKTQKWEIKKSNNSLCYYSNLTKIGYEGFHIVYSAAQITAFYAGATTGTLPLLVAALGAIAATIGIIRYVYFRFHPCQVTQTIPIVPDHI